MSNETQSDKVGNNGLPFNPTVTAMFEAPKFGHRSFNGDATAAFLSMPLDDKAITTLQNAKQGEKLLLKRSTKLNKAGGSTYYLEVLPAQGATKTFTEKFEDGI